MFGFEPAWQTRRVRLEALRTAEGHELPARLKAEIVRQIERLELSLRQIAEVEAARDAALAAERQAAVADEAPPAEATDAKPGMLPAGERAGARLLRLKRIGPETASALRLEVVGRPARSGRQDPSATRGRVEENRPGSRRIWARSSGVRPAGGGDSERFMGPTIAPKPTRAACHAPHRAPPSRARAG